MFCWIGRGEGRWSEGFGVLLGMRVMLSVHVQDPDAHVLRVWGTGMGLIEAWARRPCRFHSAKSVVSLCCWGVASELLQLSPSSNLQPSS